MCFWVVSRRCFVLNFFVNLLNKVNKNDNLKKCECERKKTKIAVLCICLGLLGFSYVHQTSAIKVPPKNCKKDNNQKLSFTKKYKLDSRYNEYQKKLHKKRSEAPFHQVNLSKKEAIKNLTIQYEHKISTTKKMLDHDDGMKIVRAFVDLLKKVHPTQSFGSIDNCVPVGKEKVFKDLEVFLKNVLEPISQKVQGANDGTGQQGDYFHRVDPQLMESERQKMRRAILEGQDVGKIVGSYHKIKRNHDGLPEACDKDDQQAGVGSSDPALLQCVQFVEANYNGDQQGAENVFQKIVESYQKNKIKKDVAPKAFIEEDEKDFIDYVSDNMGMNRFFTIDKKIAKEADKIGQDYFNSHFHIYKAMGTLNTIQADFQKHAYFKLEKIIEKMGDDCAERMVREKLRLRGVGGEMKGLKFRLNQMKLLTTVSQFFFRCCTDPRNEVGFILSTLDLKDKKTKEIITRIGRKRFGDINVTVDIKKHWIAFETSKIMIEKTKLKIVECFKKMDQLLNDLPKDGLLLNSEDVCEMFKKVIVGEDRSAWAKLGEQQKERVVTLSEMVFDLYTQTTCDVREWKTSGEGVKKEMSHFLNPVVQPNETDRNEQVPPRDNHQEEHKEAYQEERQEESVFQFNELVGVNMLGVGVNPVVDVLIDTDQTENNTNRAAPETESVALVVQPNETERTENNTNRVVPETVAPVVQPNETDRNATVLPETTPNEQVSQGFAFEQATPSANNIRHTETKTGGLPFGGVGSWKKADALHTQKEPVGTATREPKVNVDSAERPNGQKLPKTKTDNDGFNGVNPLGGRTTQTNDVQRVWEPRAAEQSRGEQKLEKREGVVIQGASGGANESARGRNKRKQKSTRRRHKNSRMRFKRKKFFSKRKKTSRKKRLKK